MANIQIVDINFNCHNKISHTKNLMHIQIYFTQNAPPELSH